MPTYVCTYVFVHVCTVCLHALQYVQYVCTYMYVCMYVIVLLADGICVLTCLLPVCPPTGDGSTEVDEIIVKNTFSMMLSKDGKVHMYSIAPFERPPLGTCERGSFKEVVTDKGEISMRHIYICDQQSLSRGGGGGVVSQRVCHCTVCAVENA